MKQKYIIRIVVVASLAAGIARGQALDVNLTVNPNPDPVISAWSHMRSTVIAGIRNSSGISVQAKVDAKLLRDGIVQAQTRFESMGTLTIPPGLTQYFVDQIIPAQAVRFFGGIDRSVRHTGRLPAGDYDLCVTLLDPLTARELTQTVCQPFFITSFTAPTIIEPDDEQVFGPGERPSFRWAPIVPAPSGGVRYAVRVVEVLSRQSPAQAFRSGIPLFERESPAATELTWPADLPLSAHPGTFAWSVRALDDRGNPLGDRDGWAEIQTIVIGGEQGGNDK